MYIYELFEVSFALNGLITLNYNDCLGGRVVEIFFFLSCVEMFIAIVGLISLGIGGLPCSFTCPICSQFVLCYGWDLFYIGLWPSVWVWCHTDSMIFCVFTFRCLSVSSRFSFLFLSSFSHSDFLTISYYTFPAMFSQSLLKFSYE